MGFGAGPRPGTPRRRRTGLGEVRVPGGDIRVMRKVGGYSTVGFRANPPIDRTRASAPAEQSEFERELEAIDRELAAAERDLAVKGGLAEPREPAAAGSAAESR
ncbi:hypothetical protein K7711_24205 [Nocardia sp. CA2R105]|uniref:hypothetical protein n=1 Tax=Nocardia coffeae TaxID=2873381 RepID=UPI001CA7A584|nr:hypothetical protein [Nocardia coffeae]MBY8859591.1 hypothetical protein [Nocardia coffeae]